MPISPDDILDCYRRGVFPMADSRDDDRLYVCDPEERAIFPLGAFHVPRRLARTVRANVFAIRVDTAFADVIAACAAPRVASADTWINSEIRALYGALHMRGEAHSVEVWRGGALVGGLYGVALGAAFFGESMFSTERDASKVALVHLVARLCVGGFRLLDAQFMTPHLARFGAVSISRETFHTLLGDALAHDGDFFRLPADISGAQALQSIAQTS